jgi:hypothetical protein
MTPPRVIHVPPALNTGKTHISGIVIVEAVIDNTGAVVALRTVKTLPEGVEKVAEDMLRRSEFQPGRFFGVPVPVIYNFTVRVDRGIVVLAGRE